jgi:hypothetical protein
MSEVSTPAAPSAAPASTESTESSSSSVNESNATSTPGQESKPQAPQKYKVKANGKEEEHTLEELMKFASMGKGANQKFEEAAKYRKQAESFINRLRTDPLSVLNDPKVGINFKEIAEEYLYNQIQEERLSPEQKKQKEMEQELKKYRDKEEEGKKKQQQEQEQRLDQHYTEHYDRIITEGLSKSGLPKTAATIKSVAKYLDRALDAGLDVTVEDVIPFVKQDYLNTIQELFGASDGDTLLSLLGGNADKIRKADLARLRGMQGNQEPKPIPKQDPAPSRDEKPKYVNKYEAAENIRRKLGLK